MMNYLNRFRTQPAWLRFTVCFIAGALIFTLLIVVSGKPSLAKAPDWRENHAGRGVLVKVKATNLVRVKGNVYRHKSNRKSRCGKSSARFGYCVRRPTAAENKKFAYDTVECVGAGLIAVAFRGGPAGGVGATASCAFVKLVDSWRKK